MRYIIPIVAVIALILTAILLVKEYTQKKKIKEFHTATSTSRPSEIPYVTLIDPSKNAKEQIIAELSETINCNNQCVVNKVYGDFAKGQMPHAWWIAGKIEGTWEVIVSGNGIPSCKDIDIYSIPQEIFGDCIESSGTLRYLH